MVGGGTVDLVTHTEVRWASVPEKEEAGSPNVIGAVAMASAMLALRQVGMENLANHEAQLTAYALEKLKKIEGIRIFGSSRPEQSSQRLGVIPINVEGMSHYLAAAILSVEEGIGVRNGCFCAHPYLLNLLDVPDHLVKQYQSEIKAGIKTNLPGMIRVSFGGYNTFAEVDRLAAALQMIAMREYKGRYQQDPESGEFFADGFRPDPANYFSLQAKGG
jgi:cysteine desulfurase/selenocysteine lyase